MIQLFEKQEAKNNKSSSSEVVIAGVGDVQRVISLVGDVQRVISWFYENYMIYNTGKCHYICMGKDVYETL